MALYFILTAWKKLTMHCRESLSVGVLSYLE
jgi:hypothetical protein